MGIFESFDLVVSTLSPIHVGCGEDFVPTEYVVDAKGMLHRFDPASIAAKNDAKIASDILKALAAEDPAKQLREVHAALQRHRECIIPDAVVNVPMCNGVYGHYKKTQDPKHDFNRNGIERTVFSPIDQSPYLPGSSLKGAIRTVILNARGGSNIPYSQELQQQIRNFNSMIEEYDPGNDRLMLRLKLQYSKSDYESARKHIEKAIRNASRFEGTWLKGSFASDPLRALKVGDALPTNGHIEREIRFCLNRNRSGRRSQAQAKNLYTRLEYILEHQPEIFGLKVSLQNLREIAGHQNHRGEAIAPAYDALLSWPEIVKACNEYYLQRLDADIASVRKLCPASSWVASTQKVLETGLREQIRSGACLLLRVGKHGGADSNTVDGRQIKIMLSEDKRQSRDGREEKVRLYVFDEKPRTTWFVGDDLDKPTDLLPHGWIVLSEPNLPWQRHLPGFERQRVRLRNLAEAKRREQEAAAKEKAEAEAKAAREAELDKMTENQRRVEDFKDFCAKRFGQLCGNKDNPNTQIHQRARELVKAAQEGADWTPEEKWAAAKAVEEWLPKLVRLDFKDERKKLKLAALRGRQ